MSDEVRVERIVRRDREYFRVNTVLPLAHDVVKRDEVEAFSKELELRPWGEDPGQAGSVETRLERLERKLDRILSLLDSSAPAPLGESDLRILELSGSGVRYPWSTSLEPGTDLMLRFYLPGVTSRLVRCVGTVRSCDAPDVPGDPFMLVVSFSQISQEDRDAIVRHTLDVERRALRPGGPGDRS